MKKKRKPEIESPLNEAPGYANLGYPPDEDIFIRNEKFLFIEEASDANIDYDKTNIDDDKTNIEDGKTNIDDDKIGDPLTGEDLDVPGAELDDANEEIGAEDEENNYYSLGGDNHHDLEDNHE